MRPLNLTRRDNPLPQTRLMFRSVWLRRALLLSVLLSLLLIPAISMAQGQAATQTRAERATVFIMQAYDVGGTQALSCVGSGTLISSSGLILTNAHLAVSMGPCRAEKVIIALPVRPNEPPVPTYLAEVVQTDIEHNLAILQISAGLDGSRVESETLNLPFVPITSEAIVAGDAVTLVGYPDIGGESVLSFDSSILTTSAETSGGKQAWLRIGEAVGGGMSGGGAYDMQGELVGVMTSAPTQIATEPSATCRSLQDTNRDNLIDERDACVPIGAALTTVRPIAFAETLVRAAREGLRVSREGGLALGPPGGTPTVSRVFFSQQVSDSGTPTRIVEQLSGGARSLFLFFNFENMLPGTPYEIRATLNGRETPEFGQGPQVWGGGQRGLWYIGTENVTLPSGNYEFTVFVDGRITETASLQIGGEPDQPTFNGLTFGIFDESGTFTNSGTFLPANVTTVTGRFNYENMREGLDWTEVWYFGSEEVFRNTLLWSEPAAGQRTVNAINLEGLPPGIYRLDLLVGQELAATGDLTLAGIADRQQSPVIFSELQTSSDISRDGLPSGVRGGVLPPGTSSIYAFASWDNIPNGVEWTQLWTRDGRPIASATDHWDSGQVGDNFWVNLSTVEVGGLADGNYRVEIFVEGRLMTATTASVGTGAGALSGSVSEANNVEVTGIVVDALSGEGIPNVGLYVLKTEFDFVDFLWDTEQLQAQGLSDRQGRFVLSDALPRGTLYTFLVRAEGYLPVTEDGFAVLDQHESPMDILIELTTP